MNTKTNFSQYFADNLSKPIRSLTAWMLIFAAVMMVAGPNICLPCLPYLVNFFETEAWVLKLSLMMTPFMSSFSGFIFTKIFNKGQIRAGILSALILFIIGSFLCGYSKGIFVFFLGRSIQSFAAGGMTVGALSTLNYFFNGVTLTRYMAAYGILFPLTFAISPAIGSFLFSKFGFSSCFYFLGFEAVFVLVILQKILIDFTFEASKKMKEVFFILLKSKKFVTLVLCHSIPIATLQYYMAQSSFLWINKFKYSMLEFSLIQIIPIAMQFFATIIYRIIVKKIGIQKCIKIGHKIGGIFCLTSSILLLLHFLNGSSFKPITFLATICIFFLSAVFFIVPHISLAMEYGKEFGTATSAQISATTNVVTSLGFVMAAIMSSTVVNIILTMTILVLIIVYLSKNIKLHL